MPLQKLDLTWALTAPLTQPDFVLPGLLPKTFGLIVAPGGTGKSMLALDLAISLATGKSVASGLFPAGPSGKAIFLAGEENDHMLAHRLRSMVPGNELDNPELNENLILLPMAGESCLLISKDGKPTKLYEELKAISVGARLIIIDPLRRIHGGDENNSYEMTRFVVLMERLAKSTGAAVIALHHANRSSQDTGSQNASRGSSALVDGCRWQINLSRMDEKTAQMRSISDRDRHLYVAVDFAKTNYLESQPRMWLKRQPGGRLILDPLTNMPPVKPKKANPVDTTIL